MPHKNSMKKYKKEILILQFLQVPFNIMKDIKGILSYHNILFLQFRHFDLPKITSVSCGSLKIQTFAKLPRTKPAKKNINISKVNKLLKIN
tara:strand:+ start:271 stop:543 length:273 start_codon:yes stop_codon:yes gene_type:complete